MVSVLATSATVLIAFSNYVPATQSGQALTTLSKPLFVAEKANEINWNHTGKFLGFAHRNENNHVDSIGVFDLTKESGKVLLQLDAKQTDESRCWLVGGPYELVAISEPSEGAAKPSTRLTVLSLDAAKMTVRKLWTAEIENSQKPSITIDPSPLIPHALVKVRTVGRDAYFTVTPQAAAMVISNDVSEARAQGNDFAGWSSDGTALFGPSPESAESVASRFNSVSDQLSTGDVKGELYLSSQIARIDRIAMYTSIKVRPRPNFEPGSAVLEMLPNNGVLRSVRFNGYFPEEKQSKNVDAVVKRDDRLKFMESESGTQSLWLTRNRKDAKQGLLIASQAEEAWLEPHDRSVAFLTYGVLFVRKIQN